jgi:DNA-binding transcriptional regulator YiaG
LTPAKLRSLIEHLGLSQAEVARLFGVTSRAVQFWVTGERPISGPALVLFKLLDCGKIKPKDLFVN